MVVPGVAATMTVAGVYACMVAVAADYPRIVMRRRELQWWVAVIIALSLLLFWVGSCEDWSWLPNAPYDGDS